MVAVTSDELVVTPRFPFNLMFLPEVYGLETRISRSRVRVENASAGLLKRGVIVVVDGADHIRMELRLRDKKGFLTALEAK